MNQALHFFEQAIIKNRLSHLYLISGPKGSGKMQLANDVCYLIFNQGKPESRHLRQQITEKTLTNLMVIEPDNAMIRKEQILQLQEEFSKTALVDGPRVYILKNVEKMNQSAANSLLKFMEEPLSEKVFGFLLTENLDSVLATIQSRAQIIHLRNIDEEDLKRELLNQGVDEKIATLAPYVTKDIDEAIALSNDPNFQEMVKFIEYIAESWRNTDVIYPIVFSKQGQFLLQDREFFKNFLELLLLYYMDLIHYRANQPIIYDFLRESIQVQSDALKVSEIHEVIEIIQDILKRQNYFINLELALDELAYTLEQKR